MCFVFRVGWLCFVFRVGWFVVEWFVVIVVDCVVVVDGDWYRVGFVEVGGCFLVVFGFELVDQLVDVG